MQRHASEKTTRPAKSGKNSAPARRGSLRAMKGILPHVWPRERPDLKRTVLVSLVLMLFAKLVTVAMPFTYKWATDALVAATSGQQPASGL